MATEGQFTLINGHLIPNVVVAAGAGAAGITASAVFTPAAAAYLGGDIISVAQEFAWTDHNGVVALASNMTRPALALAAVAAPASATP